MLALLLGAVSRMDCNILYTSFFVVFIAFGISVVTKLFMNQYTIYKECLVINALVIEQIIKLFILIFYVYFKASNGFYGVNSVEHIRFLVEFLVAGCIEAFIILVSPRDEKFYKKFILGIVFSSFVGAVLCGVMPLQYMSNLCHLINLVSLLAYSLGFCRTKDWKKEAFNHQRMYCKLFVLFGMARCIAGLGIKDFYQTYQLVCITFNLMQGICLLICVYKGYLWELWNEKMNALNEADYIITKQNEVCDLIVSLSHELKTPVHVIRSALDIMGLDYKEDEMILKEVGDIRKECTTMMNMVQNMIDVQRIKGKHIQIKYETLNLVEAVENVVDAFSQNMSHSSFLFNPQEEEIYQDMDLKLLQHSFLLGFNLLIQQEPSSEIYIEIGRSIDTRETYMLIKHSALEQIKKWYDSPSNKLDEGRMVAVGLTIELIQLILELHHTRIECEEMADMTVMKIIFPECIKVSEVWLDEDNIMALGEQMKVRDMVS